MYRGDSVRGTGKTLSVRRSVGRARIRPNRRARGVTDKMVSEHKKNTKTIIEMPRVFMLGMHNMKPISARRVRPGVAEEIFSSRFSSSLVEAVRRANFGGPHDLQAI
uniref:Uncharacterized protein n=1 Tax=Ananas comosus var. bracteatus TaxID=296719 RepID=A0A6V7PHU4_ANACO|nr:unnamed protein product [Ananas comosus var. bracteatus]